MIPLQWPMIVYQNQMIICLNWLGWLAWVTHAGSIEWSVHKTGIWILQINVQSKDDSDDGDSNDDDSVDRIKYLMSLSWLQRRWLSSDFGGRVTVEGGGGKGVEGGPGRWPCSWWWWWPWWWWWWQQTRRHLKILVFELTYWPLLSKQHPGWVKTLRLGGQMQHHNFLQILTNVHFVNSKKFNTSAHLTISWSSQG